MLVFELGTAAGHHLSWTGTDGVFPPDQLQYLAWVRDASRHGLVSDLFVLAPSAHDYLQPAIAVSGGLTALGVVPWLALLLWKPVAVLGILFAVRAYCRRMLPPGAARYAALAAALFAGSAGVLVDEWLPFWAWGYPFGLMAAAAMIGALLLYARDRERLMVGWAAPLLGLIASWLHPWQGELLILIVVGAEAACWLPVRPATFEPRRLLLPAVTIVFTALPLLYYGVLDHADLVWRLGRAAGVHPRPFWRVTAPLLPMAAIAALAYRKPPRDFLQAATMAWPIAAVVVFELSLHVFAATPLHAFLGITIPLAILAVQGVRNTERLRRLPRAAAIGWLAVAAATVPFSVHMLQIGTRNATRIADHETFITHDERRALDYLASDRTPGGVISDFALGSVVPGVTGRRTYVGDATWSVPRPDLRYNATFNLFFWVHESRRNVRRLVSKSGARFVLASCHARDPHLAAKLGPLLVAIHRFGCATVYQVRAGPRYLI